VLQPEAIVPIAAAPTPFTGVILAAQRAGVVDPLAQAHGISHKCLVPIAGLPLIAHVVAALQATPGLARLRIVVEPAMFGPIRDALGNPPLLDFVPAANNFADSVLAAACCVTGPLLVTTADNVLLTPGAVLQILDVLRDGADAGIAMASKRAVLAAHPEGQRRFYRFRENEYSNCNLYAFAGRAAVTAAESFRSGGQFAKKPARLIAAVGVFNVILFLARRLSLHGALARMSRRFGLKVVPTVLADGSHAIDVDNERTYRVAATLLEQRAARSRAIEAAIDQPLQSFG
jgi:GTP:adenosylcobinamide-phosphate guanylyltransferase